MTHDVLILGGTAASIGFLHTLFGPDHYLPFVAMARAGRWSLAKTIIVTALCGLGHVLGSVALGFVGIALGVSVFKLEGIESQRADLAGWLLLAFGLVYFLWGLRRAVRQRPHTHWHAHDDGTIHTHGHVHEAEHLHVHSIENPKATTGGSPMRMTPWVLFTIFIFGPCEPLIPLLMYPASKSSLLGVVVVAVIFSVTTIATMTILVVLATLGLGSIRMSGVGRFNHAAAGLAVAVCGVALMVGF